MNSGRNSLDFALADAVLQFNDGKIGHIKMFSMLGLSVGKHSCLYFSNTDSRRIISSAKKSSEKQKQIRMSKRALAKEMQDTYKHIEGTV